MSKTISKLSKLINPSSFLQIDVVKGYIYVDKAGELVNKYHDHDSAPQFQMNLGGLIIKNPTNKISEIKISPQVIWMKFTSISSLDSIIRIYCGELERICQILNIDKFTRIGWRNYFIFDFPNIDTQKKYFEKLNHISNTKLSIIRCELTTNQAFKSNLIIQPVVKNDEPKIHSVLFDVDVFLNNKNDIADSQKTLEKFRQYLTNDKPFLDIINNTFI